MKKIIQFPECWEDLTQDQFIWLLKYMSDGRKVNDLMEIKLHFTDFLLGKRRPWLPCRRNGYMNLLNELAESLDWLFRLEGDIILFNYDTTMNLLPKVNNLLGPLSHGADLRFGEYREAVAAYNEYTTTFEDIHLDRLVGILYRPAAKKKWKNDFDGNWRIPFNRYSIGEYMKLAKRVPGYIKWGIYLWFASFCKYLLSGGVFIIDGKEISFSRLFRNNNDNTGVDIGMNAILFTMADNGTFGKAEDTDQTELFRVLLKLLHDANTIDIINKKNKR